MNSVSTSGLLLAALIGAIFLGRIVRKRLPDHHLSGESRDGVKMAMGLVSTMTALLLGLLVGSAKGTFDAQRSEVILMAAQVAHLDRLLRVYGPEAAGARRQFQDAVRETASRMWPGEARARGTLDSNSPAGDSIFHAVNSLIPRDDEQRELKSQATAMATSLGLERKLMVAQATGSIPRPLLIAFGWWLVVIFFFFSVLAPTNGMTMAALVSAAVSVAVAVVLVLELDQPLGGLIRVSSEPMMRAMSQFGQ